MLETRLPPRRGPAPGASVATGTPATSERSGSLPSACSQRRAAPPTTASTTSFMVTPLARWIALISAIGSVAVAKLRRAVSAPLKGVRGTSSSGRGTLTDDARRCRMTAAIALRVRETRPGSWPICSTASTRASRSWSNQVGVGSSVSTLRGRSRAGRGSALRPSTMLPSRALAATPSASAWCILVITAIRSSPNGWQTCISHSGRVRSSGVPATRPISASSPCIPPGCRDLVGEHVMRRVHAPVGDPQRVVEVERRRQRAAAQRRQLLEAGQDLVGQPGELEGVRRLEQRDLERVHVHRRRLHVEVAGVDAFHAVHVAKSGSSGARLQAQTGMCSSSRS